MENWERISKWEYNLSYIPPLVSQRKVFLKQMLQIAVPQMKNNAWSTVAAMIRWKGKYKERYITQNYAQKMHSTLPFYSELWRI